MLHHLPVKLSKDGVITGVGLDCWGGDAMTGIQYLTDEKGQKTAAVIDLKMHKALWNISDVLVLGLGGRSVGFR